MSEDPEEKRCFSYMHMKFLMMLAAAQGVLLATIPGNAKFDNFADMEAYHKKIGQELEDKISHMLNQSWEKAK